MKIKISYFSALLALLILFPRISFSQYADTELGHDGFMGPVKSARITAYQVVITEGQATRGDFSNYQLRSYTKSGKLKSVIDYSADGIVTRTQEYTYDKKGKLMGLLDRMGEEIIKKETYDYDKKGNLIENITYSGEGAVDSKKTNVYNKSNQLVESFSYSSSFGELNLDQKIKLEYDKDGNKVKESYYGPLDENWGSVEIKFDSKGNMVEWLNLTEEGKIKVRQTYQYDEENILTIRKSFDENGKLMREVNLDVLGQPLSLIRYDDNGNISRKSGNRYDKFGNRRAELRYENDGTESVYAEYKYSFDNENNWIEQTAYQNEQAAYIIGREITYY